MRLVISFVLLSATFSANAAPLEFACWWEQHAPTNTADDTGQFFDSQRNSLKLEIDVESNSVELPERTDAIVFPNKSMTSMPDRIELSFVQPNMRAIKGKPSLLKLSIDRFTLDSWITLALPTGPSGQMQSRWIRRGQCVQKKF